MVLAIHLAEADGKAYRDWIPRWALDLHKNRVGPWEYVIKRWLEGKYAGSDPATCPSHGPYHCDRCVESSRVNALIEALRRVATESGPYANTVLTARVALEKAGIDWRCA
jgi:hypothetical protein